MESLNAALDRLKEGNKRHVSGLGGRRARTTSRHRRDLILGQQPFAVILGCADSRVPPEIVFDQGPGDLFVIRVAGNIASTPQKGSIDFAVDVLGTKLVVVLGHSQCGAVEAALAAVNGNTLDISEALQATVDPIIEALNTGDEYNAQSAEMANVASVVEQLSASLPDDTTVVGAHYNIGNGKVEFLSS